MECQSGVNQGVKEGQLRVSIEDIDHNLIADAFWSKASQGVVLLTHLMG